MSGHMMLPMLEQAAPASSAELAAAIAACDFSCEAATVVGYGNMGKEYVKALRQLGVSRIRVCSRSAERLQELRSREGIELVAGGYEALACRPASGELAIVATPIPTLIAATDRLVELGFHRLLIEKPVALSAHQIGELADALARRSIDAMCAYNRVAYPSFHEVRARAAQEGGITSCLYTFTEMVNVDWPSRFSGEELRRWGIGNSLHVIGMAHGLIGQPGRWHGFRAGSLSWHPAGTIFVGAGISDRGIPFAYHADWGSKSRWSVEVHTRVSSYRLCPLEKVFRKTLALSDWEEIPVTTLAPDVKSGFVEQVAAMLKSDIRQQVPLPSVRQAQALARVAEDIFGYHSNAPESTGAQCDS